MFKLSRETDLALLLLTDLARRKGMIKLRLWAKERGLPYRFLSKIAGKLKQAGLLSSKEGREGGYKLAKKPGRISLAEVTEIFEDGTAPVGCLKGKIYGCDKYCGHKNIIGEMSELVNKQLKKITLKNVLSR